ncbi:MAG TPA: WXG100 family type VII secretion target [Mycobacteriales bacterium]|nr:WXG100 family type VII secretion target [Mycobacteriales bacterium]
MTVRRVIDKTDIRQYDAAGYGRAEIMPLLAELTPGALADASTTWHAAARGLRALRQALRDHAVTLADVWEGAAAGACQRALRRIADSADALAGQMESIGTALGTAGNGQRQAAKELAAAEDDARHLLVDGGYDVLSGQALDDCLEITHRRALETAYAAYRTAMAAIPDVVSYDLPGLAGRLRSAGRAGSPTLSPVPVPVPAERDGEAAYLAAVPQPDLPRPDLPRADLPQPDRPAAVPVWVPPGGSVAGPPAPGTTLSGGLGPASDAPGAVPGDATHTADGPGQWLGPGVAAGPAPSLPDPYGDPHLGIGSAAEAVVPDGAPNGSAPPPLVQATDIAASIAAAILAAQQHAHDLTGSVAPVPASAPAIAASIAASVGAAILAAQEHAPDTADPTQVPDAAPARFGS